MTVWGQVQLNQLDAATPAPGIDQPGLYNLVRVKVVYGVSHRSKPEFLKRVRK